MRADFLQVGENQCFYPAFTLKFITYQMGRLVRRNQLKTTRTIQAAIHQLTSS
nr:MAG TPA: hypothetical protein [Caudoviricetes sp.]